MKKNINIFYRSLTERSRLKHMCAGNPHVSDHQLRHIKNYFLFSDNLKNAQSKVANALFKIRLEEIWGGMPIAVASDSIQFSAYFQNLISEYHNRYGGRGVMIYWHVEKNACCIHSQLKSVLSSVVSAMSGRFFNDYSWILMDIRCSFSYQHKIE